MENREEAYLELCKRWESAGFKARSTQRRQNRGTDPRHRYGGDGHIRKAKRMVSLIQHLKYCMNVYMLLTFVYRQLRPVSSRVTSKSI